MKMSSRKWTFNFIEIILAAVILVGALVIRLDPFFHYHAPLEEYYYILEDQRSQNDGITRHFAYDAMITGTSNTENFRTSEFDDLFGTDSVKVPYPGATFKEVGDNIRLAYKTGHDPKVILRSIDDSYLIGNAEALREDMGEYPYYLYNRNPFDDTAYWLNRDVLLRYCLPMLAKRIRKVPGGVDSFDGYSADDGNDTYGPEQALYDVQGFPEPETVAPLTAQEEAELRENVEKNVTSIAAEHPGTQFYLFFPPFSIVRWGTLYSMGFLERQIRAQEIAVSMMLEYDNIKLFSFSTDTELITDLDHYKDAVHYSPEVSSLLLERMHDGEYQITKENAEELFRFEREYYGSYDYASLLPEDPE